MKTLAGISDLEQYGVGYLTDEACAMSHRLLFDLNTDGAALMRDYFGLPPTHLDTAAAGQFADAWSSAVNGKPAVASLLLPRTPEFYRDLFKVLLFREGYEVVTVYGDQVTGMSDADLKEVGFQSLTGQLYRNPRIPNQPAVGTSFAARHSTLRRGGQRPQGQRPPTKVSPPHWLDPTQFD